MHLVWKIHIPYDDVGLKLLGLTFVERRLREAKAWGVEKVYLLGPPQTQIQPIRLRQPLLAAAWEWVPSEAQIPEIHRDHAYPITLNALIESYPPHRVRLKVTGADDVAKAEKILANDILQTLSAGWIARNVNKPISLFLSRHLSKTFMTPNLWSLFNLIVGCLSGVFVAQGQYWSVALGGLLIQVASVFDGVDGEIAKFRLESTRFGAWVDTAVDNLSLLFFLFGLGAHVYVYSAFTREVALYLLALTGFGSIALLLTLGHFVYRKLGSGSLAAYDNQFFRKLPQEDPLVSGARKIKHLIKKDFFSFLFFTFCLLGWVDDLLVIAAFGPIVALTCVLYFNSRYAGLVEEYEAS